MAASYLPYEPDQDFLLPPSLSEWLPEGHLAYFISDSVDALDLTAFHARYDTDAKCWPTPATARKPCSSS
jgi:hypothetical protein